MTSLLVACMPGQQSIADIQPQLSFSIITPCWLPTGVKGSPEAKYLGNDAVEIAYRVPGKSPLRIIEQPAVPARLMTGGEPLLLDRGIEAVVSEMGESVSLEWIYEGIRYQVVNDLGRADTLAVAGSMILGCP
jgi:hypothetical protein